MKRQCPSNVCQWAFFALLNPATANAQGLNEFQTDLAAGTVHAAAQIGGAMGLFLMVTALGGALMIISTIKRYMNAESNERETMNGGKLLAGLALGTLAVIFPFVIALGHNTLWAGSPITAQSFGALAIDGSLASQSASEIQEGQGPGRYVPGAALVAFYGILILIGCISIYMGIRDAWIATMYGNDMYGTSMPFKSSKVLGHLIFGFGLVFINKTQCMVMLTFGGTERMCW
jgi:hypothetical protein